MKIRSQTLWKIPVYCAVASWLSFYIKVDLGRHFFVVVTTGADGVVRAAIDPVRSAIFDAALFLIVLLIGGLWVRCSMNRKEIAVSAGIASAIYLQFLLMELFIPSLPPSLSLNLAFIQTWPNALVSCLLKIVDNATLLGIVSAFSPMLFILFGRKSAAIEEAVE